MTPLSERQGTLSERKSRSEHDLRRHQEGEKCQCRTKKYGWVPNPFSAKFPPVRVRLKGPAQIREYYTQDQEGNTVYKCKTCGKLIEPVRGIAPGVKRVLRNKYQRILTDEEKRATLQHSV